MIRLFMFGMLLLGGIACNQTKNVVVQPVSKETIVKTDNEPIKVDVDSGMKMGENWQLVRAHCTACHSGYHFLKQTGNRYTWSDMIDWMQKTQGLWQFDKETEEKIMNYLVTYYAPNKQSRRAAIPLSLMPKNPYAPKVEFVKAVKPLPTQPTSN
jgi:hypothetical protein